MSTSTEENALVQADSWAERAADRSPVLQKRRSRDVQRIEAMVGAAKRLIVEKGGGFTAQELIREAGVALQTFYRHFASKDQLLLAALEDLMATHAAQGAEAARDLPDPLARLHFYVVTALGTLDGPHQAPGLPQFITTEHWRLHQLFPEEVALATRPIISLFAKEIGAAQAQGLIAVSDVTCGAELMVTLVRSVYHQFAFARKHEPTEALAEHVWEFCLQGLGGRTEGRTAPR